MSEPKEIVLENGWLERQLAHNDILVQEQREAYKRAARRIAAYDKANPPPKEPTP